MIDHGELLAGFLGWILLRLAWPWTGKAWSLSRDVFWIGLAVLVFFTKILLPAAWSWSIISVLGGVVLADIGISFLKNIRAYLDSVVTWIRKKVGAVDPPENPPPPTP